jgi:CUB/sushi domain-containing protein
MLGKLMDNALVIHDYNGFNIWINNKKASTNVPANDGKWHYMAFTWKSSNGQWNVYKDGSKVKSSSSAFQKDQVKRGI